jgi:hypothetical protein
MLVTLVACDAVGPPALRGTRPDYNEILQETSKEQTFLNLVRVHLHEPTLFMDVTEVDLALQLQGSFGTTLNFPQANPPNHDYLLNAGIQYQQAPTIRYVPLQGQALVAQILTPISVDSLCAMYDSGWPMTAEFYMAVTRMTPSDVDFYDAIDAIHKLSTYPYNALEMIPTRADTTSSGPNDTILLYLFPYKIFNKDHAPDAYSTKEALALWHLLWTIYEPFQPPGITEADFRIELRTAPKSFPVIQQSTQQTIEQDTSSTQPATSPLQTKATTEKTLQHAAQQLFKLEPSTRPFQLVPILRTRSALGILRDITQADLDWDLVVFVPQKRYPTLQPMVKHFKDVIHRGTSRDYYVFDSGPFTDQEGESNHYEPAAPGGPWYLPTPGQPVPPESDIIKSVNEKGYQDFYESIGYPDRGDRQRHFMLVIFQDANETLPKNAYISTICNHTRFYIDGDDTVSIRTFAMISHFLTIEAVPQSAPLTPTISVGSH